MNVQNLLTHDPPPRRRSEFAHSDAQQELQRAHQYPTRHTTVSNHTPIPTQRYDNAQQSPPYARLQPSEHHLDYSNSPLSPTKKDPKNVTFELLFSGDSHCRARLPMKVQIYEHDKTDGIVSTVKNFFGLYDEAIAGVSFEDGQGNTLIASYENFASGMTVCVRVVPDLSRSWDAHNQPGPLSHTHVKPERVPHLDEGFQMPPPSAMQTLNHAQQVSRPASRAARMRSPSPKIGGARRSAPSIQKTHSRSGVKRESRENSFQAQLDQLNSGDNKGYTSSDGEAASVTSSFRARNEQLASAEISEANIVEGGRRQKAKFESSELPLFVPPQVPAANSTSSISPQRRSNANDNASPFARPQQRTPSWPQQMQSPQFPPYGAVLGNGTPRLSMPPHGHRLRDRVNPPAMPSYFPKGGMTPRGQGFGILPTPDPTIASTISDEDVALQLMRLGDPANMSHGRTSASTMDDALSGRADIASSATSESDIESEDDQHQLERSKVNNVQLELKRIASRTNSVASEEGYGIDGQPSKRPRLSSHKSTASSGRNSTSSKKTSKMVKPRSNPQHKKSKLPHASSLPKLPISPASVPAQSRKTSSASLMGPPQLPFPDDSDLSTKPRCQRCRKSKKGCDRQRPCQRCKDAGIGIEGCVSEDEGNGRKGRFGRHMGVSITKDTPPIHSSMGTEDAGAILDGMATGQEKNKKRKR